MNKIKFTNNNHLSDKLRANWNDFKWIDEFYSFLQGEKVEGITTSKHYTPKLTQKKHLRLYGICNSISLYCRTI